MDAFVRRAELAQQLRPGATLGRYRVLARVGRGAMGVVYAAHDPQLDRNVALKVLLDDHASDEEVAGGRLLREARSMAKLAHPNIVTVFEVGVANGRVHLAMELVEGTTLAEWLARAPSRDRVLALFVDVARALGAAHRAGVVHRDLKPHNILVSVEGQAKVTDFGLADAGAAVSGASDTSSVLSLTRTRGVVGTPAYMAPEVLLGARATALSDQFSFAVCVHEALTGRRPYEAETLAELEARVASAPPTVDASLDPKMEAILRRALAREPEERFASMGELAEALASLSSTTSSPPAQRASRRLWPLAGLALASVVAATAVALPPRATTARAPETKPVEPETKPDTKPVETAPAPPAAPVREAASPPVPKERARAIATSVPPRKSPEAPKPPAPEPPPAAPAPSATSDWLRARR